MNISRKLIILSLLLSQYLLFLVQGQTRISSLGCLEVGLNQECTHCQEGYNLIESTAVCEYSLQKCQSQQGECTIPYCLLENDDGKCAKCTESHILQDGECKQTCEGIGYIQSIQSSCNQCSPSSQFYQNNCSQCYFEKMECDICQEGYFLLESKCVEKCPSGYFINKNHKCIQCNMKCKECSSLDECLSCKFDTALLPFCDCVDSAFFEYKCVKECPPSYITSDVCKLKCNQYEYAVVSRESSTCLQIKDSSDQYCLQNLEDLPNFIRVEGHPLNEELFRITIILYETPSLCYDYQLFGIGSNYFYDKKVNDNSNSSNSNITYGSGRETYVLYDLQYSSLLNPFIVENSIHEIRLQLKIFWQYQVLHILDININKNITGYLTNEIYSSGTPSTERVVCDNCMIPVEQTITSKLVYNCQVGQICEESLIQAPTGTSISLTQQIIDDNFANIQVQPHSLKLEIQNSLVTYITNYKFDNSVIGQITYTFSLVGISSGKLTVTSVINKSGRLLSESSLDLTQSPSHPSSSLIKYPIMIVYLEIVDDFQEIEWRLICETSLVVLCLMVFLFIYISKRKNKFSSQEYDIVPIINSSL